MVIETKNKKISKIALKKLFNTILKKSSIRPPIEVSKNNDLITDFSTKCERFKDCLKEYIDNNNDDIFEPLRFSWRVFCLSDQAATSRSFSEA
ncbi:Uncharacterised protein [Enterobacter kobei]|nr:Uncharacterised protein [Enterobacter kobei]